MGPVVGIDLGTTYSCLAFLEEGKAQIIPNLSGMRTTPSVVSFTSGGEILVGHLAQRQAVLSPKNTVYAVKRLLGRKFDTGDVQETRRRVTYQIGQAPNGDVQIELESRLISPQEIAALILQYLKKSAEAYFGREVEEAIVTVPAHYNDHQRQATKDAARIAGLNVIRIINEPTAASLAFGLDRKENALIAVYDLGGGTFDITLLEVHDGVFHVLGTSGNSFLGGEDFDNRIVDWLIEKFNSAHNTDIRQDKLAQLRIREAAEKAKRELSFALETEINLPFIHADRSGSEHIREKLTRAKLESLTQDIAEKTLPYIRQVLDEAGLGADRIDKIALIGGQAQMPLVRKKISEFFGKDPVRGINPEESVALGAAIQAGILQGLTKAMILLDVTSHSLGIETENDKFVRITEKNTTIPAKKTMAFTTVEDNQTRVKIHVLQGESEKASENTSLGVFTLVGIGGAPAGVPQIDVTFEVDADGTVKVSARDLATAREQQIEVRPSSGLSEEEMQRIIQEQRTKQV